MHSAGNRTAQPAPTSPPDPAREEAARPESTPVQSKPRRCRSSQVARTLRAIGIIDMTEDVGLLIENRPLLTLLTHYADAGAEDRLVWQDRVMTIDGAKPDDLVTLHGLLLAGDWLEQNTGATPVLRRDGVPCCYRITTAGQRALRRVRERLESGDEELN